MGGGQFACGESSHKSLCHHYFHPVNTSVSRTTVNLITLVSCSPIVQSTHYYSLLTDQIEIVGL